MWVAVTNPTEVFARTNLLVCGPGDYSSAVLEYPYSTTFLTVKKQQTVSPYPGKSCVLYIVQYLLQRPQITQTIEYLWPCPSLSLLSRESELLCQAVGEHDRSTTSIGRGNSSCKISPFQLQFAVVFVRPWHVHDEQS